MWMTVTGPHPAVRRAAGRGASSEWTRPARPVPVVPTGQRMGRWTFSLVAGPGVASAIQGPSPLGSTMPSSSQVYAPSEDAVDDRAVEVVGVGPQPAEELLDADPGLPAEGVGELVGLPAVLTGGAQMFGAYAGGAHREEFRADVDDPAEEALLGLHPALPARHRVEGGAGQLAGGAFDVPQMAGEVRMAGRWNSL